MHQETRAFSLAALAALSLSCANSGTAPPPQAVPAVSATPAPGVGMVAPTPVPKTFSLSSPDDEKGMALIRKAVDGMGGTGVVDGVKTLELRGKATRKFPGGNSVDFNSTTYLAFPDRYRSDVQLPMGSLVTVWTPEGAFTDMGDGPVKLPDVQTTAMEQGFRRNLVGLLKARTSPGFVATAKGPGKTPAGAAVELVEVRSGGHTTVLGIDPASGRILSTSWSGRIGAGGEPGETVSEFTDFRAGSDGLIYPYALTSTFAGTPTHSVVLESVLVNATIDPALFEPKGVPVSAEPAVAPTPGGPTPAATPGGPTPAATPGTPAAPTPGRTPAPTPAAG
jgi:hypothetical protein